MSKIQKNMLFIENPEMESARGIHFSESTLSNIDSFDVLHSKENLYEYHSIISGEIWRASLEKRMLLGRLCGRIVSHYLKKYEIPTSPRILAVGLGNPDIVTDSLGYAVSKRIKPTGSISGIPSVFSFPALVSEMTGFETSSIVLKLKDLSHADIIFCIDSLTARTRDRLQSVIQITDIGITPGSAVSDSSREISSETMGVPVISVGVPMAISEDRLSSESEDNTLLTRAECDVIRDTYASVIAHGLLSAFFGNIGDSRNTTQRECI